MMTAVTDFIHSGYKINLCEPNFTSQGSYLLFTTTVATEETSPLTFRAEAVY